MSRLRALWMAIRSSLWFLPALLVAGATALAAGLVYLDELYALDLQERWPRLFGAGAEGSRALLSAIATTMLTVAGTMFSITLAVLSLAASQYSPRVIRTFISDRPTQAVLGTYVALFAYCLVVLRTIRGGEAAFVPSLAVLGAMVLALIAVALLVYFIHHLAASIQAAAILGRVTAGTAMAIENLFPEDLGAGADETAPDTQAQAIRAWTAVPARRSGYVVTVDNAALLAYARNEGRVVRMALAIGDFAVQGEPLAFLAGDTPAGKDAQAALDRCYTFGAERTIEQDAAFGLQEIVDVALKALSPGINDQSTAILCIDRLSELLAQLGRRRIESPHRGEPGKTASARDAGTEPLRVIARGPTFEGLLSLAFRDICEAASGKPAVLVRLLRALERIAGATSNRHRRRLLAREASRVAGCAARTVQPARECEQHAEHAAELERSLEGPIDR